MAKQPQKRQEDGQAEAADGGQAPVRPYIVRLEWRREPLHRALVLWTVFSDGSAVRVPELGG